MDNRYSHHVDGKAKIVLLLAKYIFGYFGYFKPLSSIYLAQCESGLLNFRYVGRKQSKYYAQSVY